MSNVVLLRFKLVHRFRRNINIKSSSTSEDYRKCFQVLELKEDCTNDDLRYAFLNLAKKYHPDSSNQEADAEKFLIIEQAYRKLQEKFDAEKQLKMENDDEDLTSNKKASANTSGTDDGQNLAEFDIEHTAPQHRQYLNYSGIGQGTPFQREKQYKKYQVQRAVENVYNHRVSHIANSEESSMAVVKDAKASKKTKTKYGIDRLVEDLIQESMAKGDFSNLKGAGKPLQYQNHNPFVDIATHKINQVLIENGFSPQWIMLEKEIRMDLVDLKHKLKSERALLGRLPLEGDDATSWKERLDLLMDDVKGINKKINNYNLVVPLLNKQMVHVNLRRLADKCLNEEPSKFDLPPPDPSVKPNKSHLESAAAATSANSGFFGLFSVIWKQL